MYPQMNIYDRSDNSSQPAGSVTYKLPDSLVYRLRRDGRRFCRVWVKAMSDGQQSTEQVGDLFPKPVPPPP